MADFINTWGVNMESQILVGIKAIRAFVGRSWKTISGWIETQDFPAIKVDGVWESDRELILQWRKRRIEKARDRGLCL